MWVMTSVETLGYSRPSLRDEEGQILAALDRNVRAPVAQRHAPTNRVGATFEFYPARAGDIIRV